MMGEMSRNMIKIIANRLKNNWFITDASIAFKHTTEKAQEKILYAQNVAAKKYDTIVKQVNGATVIQDTKGPPLQVADPIPKQLIVWWQWYQQLTGLDKVELAKRQVIAVQDRLFSCQEKRRELTHQASALNSGLSKIYGELMQTKREDPKFVELTKLENRSLQESISINEKLALLENEEKDHFTQLATAIKEYHDSQTMNAQKYKYLSIVASALFAMVSLIGSMVYNNKRIKDVRNVIVQGQQTNENTFITTFSSLQKHIDSKLSEFSNSKNEERYAPFLPSKDYVRTESNLIKDVLTYTVGVVACIFIMKSIFG